MLFFKTLALCMTAVSAACTSRTLPPRGAVVVSKNGANGTYSTVQAGVNALSLTATGEQSLFVYPGEYFEQVVSRSTSQLTRALTDDHKYIPARVANLTVYGYTEDITSYQGNTVNITYNLALINTTNDDMTATVRAWTTNFKMVRRSSPGCPTRD